MPFSEYCFPCRAIDCRYGEHNIKRLRIKKICFELRNWYFICLQWVDLWSPKKRNETKDERSQVRPSCCREVMHQYDFLLQFLYREHSQPYIFFGCCRRARTEELMKKMPQMLFDMKVSFVVFNLNFNEV